MVKSLGRAAQKLNVPYTSIAPVFWLIVNIEILGTRKPADPAYYTVTTFGISPFRFRATLLAENGRLMVFDDFEPLSWTKVEL